ncbi:MAG: gephyrin-like molybdotransferase Glp, partial [Gemmatimonadales bacterium]
MAACGVATRFDRVRIRPGGPAAFGIFRDGRGWLALPGNPVSAMVTFELFGRPAIRAMAGHSYPIRPTMAVTLGASVRQDAVLDQYMRCALTAPDRNGRPVATPSGPQGSGMLMSMMRADCLAIIPAGVGSMAEGTAVEAQSLGHADDHSAS